MSTESDAALRAAAEAATPGPWHEDVGRVVAESAEPQIINPSKQRGLGIIRLRVDAEFIAAANPAAILDLLDRVEAAEAQLQVAKQCWKVDMRAAREAEARVARVQACPVQNKVQLDGCVAQFVYTRDLRAALGDPQ